VIGQPHTHTHTHTHRICVYLISKAQQTHSSLRQ
jgi:hypothetical protein